MINMKSTINMKSMINMTSMIHSRKKKQFLEKIEYFDYYFIFVFLSVRSRLNILFLCY